MLRSSSGSMMAEVPSSCEKASPSQACCIVCGRTGSGGMTRFHELHDARSSAKPTMLYLAADYRIVPETCSGSARQRS
jgi:hypothetical protein